VVLFYIGLNPRFDEFDALTLIYCVGNTTSPRATTSMTLDIRSERVHAGRAPTDATASGKRGAGGGT
jgi:hypothetical protein